MVRIINAYVQNLLLLPQIQGSNTREILYISSMKNTTITRITWKIERIGYVQVTVDKLGGIRGDLVRTSDKNPRTHRSIKAVDGEKSNHE